VRISNSEFENSLFGRATSNGVTQTCANILKGKTEFEVLTVASGVGDLVDRNYLGDYPIARTPSFSNPFETL
jgi:hypothetical protein